MKRLLAESPHYKIIGEYEEVSLLIKKSGTTVFIGDFYGDPEGAVTDKSERFCVIYGEGAVIYFLKEPFEPYQRDKKSVQWFEAGRTEPIEWITNVRLLENGDIELTLESGEVNVIKI